MCHDGVPQVGADFVGRLADAGPDRRHDRGRIGAQFDHGGDGGFNHADHRAAPAGMSGAGHAGIVVRQQDRCAVGGDDAKGDVGLVRHHRVGARAIARSPRCRHLNHIGTMHLHEADKAIRFGADRAGGAGSILQHRVAFVAARQAAVQACVWAAGNAALAREETMRHAERIGGQRHDRFLTVARDVVQGVSHQTRGELGNPGCRAPEP